MRLQESYCGDLKQLLDGLRHQRELRLSEERRFAEEEEKKNRVREQKQKESEVQRQRKNWSLIRTHKRVQVIFFEEIIPLREK